jgi:hypothetical protein
MSQSENRDIPSGESIEKLILCRRYILHCKENTIYVLLFWELRGLSPNFNFHVSVSNLCIYTQDQSTYFPAAE